jgi:hypothetical protein
LPKNVIINVLQVFLVLKSNGCKSFYINFEGPHVNEIISYFKHIWNKILKLIMCKFLIETFGVKNAKLNNDYACFWLLLA